VTHRGVVSVGRVNVPCLFCSTYLWTDFRTYYLAAVARSSIFWYRDKLARRSSMDSSSGPSMPGSKTRVRPPLRTLEGLRDAGLAEASPRRLSDSGLFPV